MLLYGDIINLYNRNESLRVGLVGGGFMGRGIVEVMEFTRGMKIVAISDIDLEKASSCFEGINFKNYREIGNAEEAKGVKFPEYRLITKDFKVITELEGIDFIIEATGIPEIGAQVAYFSIMKGKNIGMLNVETDATIGYYLSALAKRAGVVYTVCTGDEPPAIKELYDFAKTLGFTVVACGKGKNNPLDVKANPESLKEKAKLMGLNPKILTEFVDGSKTMVEMCSLANATGLTIDKRNMHGPNVNIKDLTRVFRTRDKGGILTREGVVDYVIGDLAPGVFIIIRHEGEVVNETLKYLRIGEGPEFLLYRPYHLTNIEVPISVAIGYFYKKPFLATENKPKTEVTTYAKRNLKRGEYIDSLGGYTVYGGLEDYDVAKRENLLPLGLAEGAKLKEDVNEGSLVTLKQVEIRDTLLYHLRKIQDSLHD